MDGGGCMGMANVFKGKSHDFGFSGIEEQGAEFGFGCGFRNAFEDGSIGDYDAV